MSWSAWVESQLAEVRAAGRWRQLRSFDALGPAGLVDGRPVVSFASNDYLGLSAHPGVVAAASEAAQRWGTGATASRLIVGTRPAHAELEAAIADWKGCERALVFASGYLANLGVLAAAGGPDVTVLSDELNHASIVDGCRLSRSQVRVYRHGDADHLDELLAGRPGRCIVVTDSVFSMDGDLAPLDAVARSCARHGALLVVDEAHHVLGPDPLAGVDAEVELIRIGTLSKTLGSLGGWVAADGRLVDLLVNRARPFIFTTGLPPGDAAAALVALRILRSTEGDVLRRRLRESVDRVRAGHPSPIIPFVLGAEGAAVHAADALLERGLLVPAIRPPTVPAGTSRLRVAMSAAHTEAMVDELIAGIDALGPERE